MQREKNVKIHISPGSATMPTTDDPLLSLVAQIVSAHVEHNDTHAAALPDLIRDVYGALASAGTQASQSAPAPAARRKGPSSQTVFDDHLVCMDCGLHMKMLKRHLQTVHSETPAQYRAKWSLPGDYPMVAREYATLRSSLAKESGLGKRLGPRGR
jgi:predicted transcriptional regulator